MIINKDFFLIYLIICLLSSCSLTSIGSVAGNAATSEKGFKGSVKDMLIYAKVKSSLAQEKIQTLLNINVNVSAGYVLLVGSVQNNEERFMVIKKVWQVEGVRKIYNEIKINDNYGLYEKAKDNLLRLKIKSSLLLNSKVLSNNYLIESFKGVVYLMGVSNNLDEVAIVENQIKKIDGVRKLINLVSQKKYEE